MQNSFSIKAHILNPISSHQAELRLNQILTIDKGKIASIVPASTDNNLFNVHERYLAIPGLIDLHVHLSQYRIRGLYKSALLPWLNEFVFPAEAKSAEFDYAYQLAEEFFKALYNNGTTTAVVYTAPYSSACEAAFQVAKLHNFRAFIGMTLMNQNSPEYLRQQESQIINAVKDILHYYHNPSEGLEFVLTPRFAPTCSSDLLQWVSRCALENHLWIQTHLSENKEEIKWVKDLFALDSYTDVYAQNGILTEKTLLAHCIYLSDKELEVIRNSGSKIVHCPDSNFYLHSGEFPLERIIKAKIPFALGSDVGAGTSLNMLYHAKIANYRQTLYSLEPTEAFYYITLGAAKVLNLDNKIGSLDVGKDADIVILKIPEDIEINKLSLLSQLVFTGHEWKISEVYARGIRQI